MHSFFYALLGEHKNGNPRPLRLLLRCFGSLFFMLSSFSGLSQKAPANSEYLWTQLNFAKIEKKVSEALQLSKADSQLFFGVFISQDISRYRNLFYQELQKGNLSPDQLGPFELRLEQEYMSRYASFPKFKTAFSAAIRLDGQKANLREEAANQPCTNMDFGQNFTGWSSYWQDRNTTNNNTNPTPGTPQVGTGEHCIMSANLRDPYIPALSVVPAAPAPQTSLRLGNVVSGGQLASISQTFLVSPANIVFTYRYAVVLEDPENAPNHEGLKRPHFSAILTDQKGDTIRCAKYSVVVERNLSGFTLGCEASNAIQNPANIGCPATSAGYDGSAPYTPVSLTNPISGACGGNRSFYWKDWTVVSIPLEKYLGQNVTITFTAADCTPGLHLGYAYIQAECSALPLSDPGYICSGKQKRITAPNGFAAYKWIGPGIVGPSQNQLVTINKSGLYHMILTPFSDYPCPDTLPVNVREHCPPPAETKTVCETVQGTGLATQLNLTSYTALLLDTFHTAKIVSWHNALKASNANKIADPTNVSAHDGDSFYAIISYPTNPNVTIQIANDTVALSFHVISRPKIFVPADTLVCSTGGVISLPIKSQIQFQDSLYWEAQGANLSNRFIASPTVSISYPYPTKESVQLTVTAFKQGCPPTKDSFLIALRPYPKVTVAHDTSYCADVSSFLLKGKTQGTDSVHWTTSFSPGNFLSPDSVSTFFKRPSSKQADSATFVLTGYTEHCGQTSAKLHVLLEALPIVSATASPTCVSDQRVILSGTSLLYANIASTGVWSSSGSGQFLNSKDSMSHNTYLPSSQDIQKGNVQLTLRSTGQKICPAKDTTIKWAFVPFPVADAGKNDTVCINTPISRTTKADADWKYLWTLKGSGISISAQANASFMAAKDTNSLRLIVTNSRNCIATDSALIVTVTPPLLSVPANLCLYSNTAITAQITHAPAVGTYSWSRNDTLLSVTSPAIVLNKEGLYSFRYQFKTCASDTSLFAFPIPKLLAKDTSACEKQLIQLSVNSIAGSTYYWNGSPAGTTSNTFLINSGNGISNLPVLVVDKNGCRDSAQLNVTAYPLPSFTLKGQDICPGKSAQLTATLAKPELATLYTLSYAWFKDTHPLAAPTWQMLSYDQAGNYALNLSIKGCSSIETVQVANWPSPKLDLPLHYKRCSESDPALLLTSNPSPHYAWYSSVGLFDTTRSIQVSPKQTTSYGLKVTNAFGCADSVSILVREVCPPRLFVPNVITPESNDVNAALRIFGAHYTNFEITIFSRWGEVIFNSKDPKHAWDGIYKNENMPIGTYPWIVTYEGDSEEYKGPYKKVGDVTVVR